LRVTSRGLGDVYKRQDFADHIAREIPKWAKVVKDANVHID
jgi:hypothetical protein